MIKETLEWAKERNKEVLGEVNERRVDLLLFNDDLEFQTMSELEDVAGYYDGFGMVIGIRVDDKQLILDRKETPLYFFQKSLLHEYTHYALDQKIVVTGVAQEYYPLWFQEGLADYIANDGTVVEPYDFEHVKLQELKSHEQWRAARKQPNTDVYDQSYYTIKYLIDQKGEGVIEEIIDATSESGDFKQSFKAVTGVSFEALEKKVDVEVNG